MQFLKQTNIDFLSKRKIAISFSLFLIAVGLITLLIHGGPDYSIDFLGGTEIHVHFEKPAPIAEIRKALGEVGFAKAEIKNFGSPNDVLIRIEVQQNNDQATSTILNTLSEKFADMNPTMLSVESVGPKIGKELRSAAVWAVLVSLALILLYIWIRFEFVFGVGAIVALFHDVLITLGIFSILRMEISLSVVAAFLTIVGYSLNDTIVVFDRIRENLKSMRRESFFSILNMSINQSLSRTIVTSLTTLIVVFVLYINGGEVLRTFSFALLIGIIVGTYSSIFIATPVVAEWEMRQLQKSGKTNRRRR
ncbi:MAG: protein translocase subunit SecF [candidate division KSB1 bacterium]|nr:protein translocase subunit SecF [candidate division KSB1 bacterium]